MNPIVQQMVGRTTTNTLGQVKQMIQTIKSSGNPQMMVNQMLSRNPQLNQLINQYGGDPKTAFYKYAEANGIDPEEILNLMK